MARDILSLWVYSKPAPSEQRFRDTLGKATDGEALIRRDAARADAYAAKLAASKQ